MTKKYFKNGYIGDKVGYGGLHKWIRKHKQKKELCGKCNKNIALDLANISGKYKRDVNDFKWLCRSCHMNSDGRINNIKPMKRREIINGKLICSICKKYKNIEAFGKDKHHCCGYNSRCKKCLSIIWNNKKIKI